jgi:DNA-binding XRE family transcriptional regulator
MTASYSTRIQFKTKQPYRSLTCHAHPGLRKSTIRRLSFPWHTHSMQTLIVFKRHAGKVRGKGATGQRRPRVPNAKDPRVLVGRRVRQLRIERGLSQERLAELSKLHRNYIGGVERGERNAGVLNVVKLARALRVKPMNLLDLMP